MNGKLIAIVVMCIVCVAVVAYMVLKGRQATPSSALPPLPPPVVSAEVMMPVLSTTTAPTAAPTATTAPFLVYAPGYQYPGYQYPGYQYPGHQYPVRAWPNRPRPIQPGGSWTELMNRDKDDAVAYVMSTYPNMTVSVIQYGGPMPTDIRSDRFLIVYDAYTRKVVGARIG